MDFRRTMFVLSLVALCLMPCGMAQTFRGAISGSVTDASGAAVGDATVQIVNKSTGVTRSTLSGGSGEFNVPDLALGMYTISVTKDGFGTLKMEDVEVVVSRTTNVTLSLSVAQQAAVVEVTASSATVETTSTALTGVVDRKAVAEAPLMGRDFRQMLKLSPGVTPDGNVNGNRSNNYQIDGADNNDAFHNSTAVNQGGVSGIAGTLLPIEAIDQFAIQTNASAEVGRNGGSSVNLVIKSGTNELHGSAYYFNRNEVFAERSPFAAVGTKTPKIRNDQYGFSVGGPIVKNKTFFFLTGEKQKAIAAASSLQTHPSTAWINQGRSILASYNVPVNQVSLNLLSFWPSEFNNAPATANNFVENAINDYDSYNGIVKIDHSFTANHSVSARYFGGTGKQIADVGIPYRDYFQVAPSRMHNASVVFNDILSPRLVLQTTLGINFFKQTFNDFNTGQNPLAAGLNTGVTEESLAGSPFIRISGFAGVSGTQPLGRIDSTGHITSNLSWTAGRHQFKFGGEYRRAQLDVFYDTDKRGRLNFDGSRGPWASNTGLSQAERALADYLAGYMSNSNGAIIVRGQLQRLYFVNSFDWWAHDNWQVSPTLNVNFGVRYTYHGILHDDKNSITNFLPGVGFLTPGVNADTLYPKDKNNLAPRIGFAWTPKRNGGTSLRGSYGLFYDVPALNFMAANTGFPNGGAAGVHANPGGPDPVYTVVLNGANLEYGQPLFGAGEPRKPFGVYSISPDFRVSYVQNFNLNVQHQLASGVVLQSGYVGSLGHKLPLFLNLNQAYPGTVGTVASRRPYAAQYPDYGAINQLQSIGNSNYHSWQSQLRIARWKNISSMFNYTWSKAIDNGTGVRNSIPMNSRDLSSMRGPADFDIRHIFTSYVSYEVPRFTTKAKLLFEGWQLNGLFTATSGRPFTILAGNEVSGTGDLRDRVNVVGDPYASIPSASGTAVRYFNPAAFARPAAGTFGNLGRNALYGPGFGSVDFSVFKTTPIRERLKVQIRAEIFNLFNRANYANPGTSQASSTSFGLITATLNNGNSPGLGFGEPRNVQLALKLLF